MFGIESVPKKKGFVKVDGLFYFQILYVVDVLTIYCSNRPFSPTNWHVFLQHWCWSLWELESLLPQTKITKSSA